MTFHWRSRNNFKEVTTHKDSVSSLYSRMTHCMIKCRKELFSRSSQPGKHLKTRGFYHVISLILKILSWIPSFLWLNLVCERKRNKNLSRLKRITSVELIITQISKTLITGTWNTTLEIIVTRDWFRSPDCVSENLNSECRTSFCNITHAAKPSGVNSSMQSVPRLRDIPCWL